MVSAREGPDVKGWAKQPGGEGWSSAREDVWLSPAGKGDFRRCYPVPFPSQQPTRGQNSDLESEGLIPEEKRTSPAGPTWYCKPEGQRKCCWAHVSSPPSAPRAGARPDGPGPRLGSPGTGAAHTLQNAGIHGASAQLEDRERWDTVQLQCFRPKDHSVSRGMMIMERMNTAKYLETSQSSEARWREEETDAKGRERKHPGTFDYNMQGVARSYFASRDKESQSVCENTVHNVGEIF